jgi:DNA-binding beta-propeller fold protein YncE
MRGPGPLPNAGRGPWSRRGTEVTVSIAVLITAVIVLSSSVGGMSGPVGGRSAFASPSTSLRDFAASSGSTPKGVLASCSPRVGIYPAFEAYDSADGLVYTANSAGAPISIVKPLCSVIQSVSPLGIEFHSFGVAYDPLTKEIVVPGENFLDAQFLVEVLQGTSLVKRIPFGNDCPAGGAWDPAIDAMLLPDMCSNGIDLLYLTEVSGVTRAAVIIAGFDVGNDPGTVLVADGYIFSAGNRVDVFNEHTLAFVGSFAVTGSFTIAMAWDPLNDTVVLGNLDYYPRESVVFLHVDSIKSGTFTYRYMPTYFGSGVGGIAYSPATQEIYLSPFGVSNVWKLSPSGQLTRVYLGADVQPFALLYDPVNHDMYVGGYGILYVLH